MIEKQILAIYSALQTVVTITQTAVVVVKTTLPIQGWVKNLMHIPKTEVAQTQTVAHWVVYLWQHSHLSASPLKKLQKILDPAVYHSDAPRETTIDPLKRRPVQEGKYPFPEDVWYTDVSRKRNPSK